MKQRKIFSWACAAALLLSATGCGSESPDTKEANNSVISIDAETVESNNDTTTITAATTKYLSTTADTKTTAKGTSTSDTADSAKTTVKSVEKNTTVNYRDAGGNKTTAAKQTTSKKADSNKIQNTTAVKTTKAKTSTTKTQQTTTTPAVTEPLEVDDTIYISLNGSSAQVSNSDAVSVSGNVITILQAGRYEVTGTLNDGQLIVNTDKESKVNLHLNGAGITCSTAAPLYVISAGTCVLHLDDGSSNYVQDTAGNTQSAAILSKDDLTIKGNGSLTVIGNVKHAMKSNNDIKIKNGTLLCSAVSTAIYGEDSVQITGGNITIPACKDGIKSSNIEEPDKGFVTVENAWIDIQNAAGNGIEAVTGVTISSGTVNVHSAKKAINCDYQSIADGCLYTY